MHTATNAEGYLELGYDECETCGGNRNYLEWALASGIVNVHAGVGCYGSEPFALETEGDLNRFLEDWRSRFPELQDDLTALAGEWYSLLYPASAVKYSYTPSYAYEGDV